MKIGMIGTGGMAGHHLRTLAGEPDVVIVGHASPTAGRAEAAARQWGGQGYTDVEQMLDQAQPDVVWVSVPPHQHGAIERSLLARRIPFLVEKPLAADWETAAEIGAAVAASDLIVAVGYQWRAMDTVPELQETLAHCPPQMVLGAWHDRTPPPAWWHKYATGGGQIVEQATHLIDFARTLLGEASVIAATADHYPRADFPDLDVATSSSALLQFENRTSGVSPAGIFTATCLLTGPAEVYVKFICDGLLVTVERTGISYDWGSERRFVATGTDAVAHQNRAFLAAVRDNNPSRLYCSYADALRTHRLCWTVREMAGQ